jgi:hypothetical protein
VRAPNTACSGRWGFRLNLSDSCAGVEFWQDGFPVLPPPLTLAVSRQAGTRIAALGDNSSALANALLREAGSKRDAKAIAGRTVDSSQFSDIPVARRLVGLV